MKPLLRYISFLLFCQHAIGQQQAFNFHKLGLQDGLHDGTVRCIGQDKLGYIWIGTVGSLNRFDGKNVVHFTNIKSDTTSPYGSQPRSIHTDKNGSLWIGYETGLITYDFQNDHFKRIPSLEGEYIGNITSFDDSTIYLSSRKGLIRYNTRNGNTFYYIRSTKPQHAALFTNPTAGLKYRNNKLYLATRKGLVILNTLTDEAALIPIPVLRGSNIYTTDVDSAGNIWIGTHGKVKLMKLYPDLVHFEIYDRFLSAEMADKPTMNIMGVLVDKNNNVWVATTKDGLLQYDPAGNRMISHLHNSNLPSSPSGNSYRTIFQDDKNNIWLGCDFLGVNFFEPEKILFQTILPFPAQQDKMELAVGRAVSEDKNGNIWMGNHYGVNRYNPHTNQYTIWRNEKGKPDKLYDNIVRTIYCDIENNIWIGTGFGVNFYDSKKNKMEFIPSTELPTAFYNSINGDLKGNIWFSLNANEVLYRYDIKLKKYQNIGSIPILSAYKSLSATSYVMEDSKHRLWISFSRKGVLMFDQTNGKLRHFLSNEKNGTGIIGDQIVDIKEDKTGVIWITTFNGITGIDTEKDTYTSFNIGNGMPGNWTSPLAVDTINRIWVGVNGGLVMVDASRTQLTRFTLADGLPSIGFPEHAGITAANGDIIFPSYRGFIRFNPMLYKDAVPSLRFYLGSYSIFDKIYVPTSTTGNVPRIQLASSENSFTFNLVALDYINPHKIWYAYKLDGFDKNWHFTQDPKAVYTNVPGGHYQFLFKASVNNTSWSKISAKKLEVGLNTVFYKTFWFWLLMFTATIVALYSLYRFRLAKQRQILNLQNKADLLEKEKTTIQYESLKKQLNPHFLFNSLTSLRSLIKRDAKTATSFLDGLSKVYRYILKSDGQDLIILKNELEFVKTFADLQQVRFGQGLQVKLHADEISQQKYIAPVILQNLLENAIKHNTTSTDSPLIVEVFTTEDYIVVRNNLQRYKTVETSNKRGMISLQKLYQFFTDKSIIIEEDENYYTVKIPIL